MSKTRAKKIKLLLFDVDGVMTDGRLWIVPNPPLAKPAKGGAPKLGWGTQGKGGAPTALNMIEAKGFHAHDGTAISLARLGGLKTGLITRRASATVALRARDLKLDYAYQGVMVKIWVFEEILEKEKITAREVAYIGDDVIDLPIMRRCGFAVAVANARDEVKQEAHWVTPHAGGDGAVRDAVEYILKAQGSWDSAVKQYLERGDAPK
jgi:3-deoxy-D-manno-octulosonate 8-phosphate phosphatase (KDO 8-P phosphatase)